MPLPYLGDASAGKGMPVYGWTAIEFTDVIVSLHHLYGHGDCTHCLGCCLIVFTPVVASTGLIAHAKYISFWSHCLPHETVPFRYSCLNWVPWELLDIAATSRRRFGVHCLSLIMPQPVIFVFQNPLHAWPCGKHSFCPGLSWRHSPGS